MFRLLVVFIVVLTAVIRLYGQPNKDIFLLDGGWGFRADTLISPNDVSDVSWERENLPEIWNSYSSRSGGPFGHGTFYKRVLLPAVDGLLAIRLPDVLSAHKVFIDGELLYESGQVGRSRQEEIYGNYRYIRLLPDHLLPGDSISIVIQLSNFHHRSGGISRSVELGSYEEMIRQKEQNLFFEALQLGGVLAMGMFFLIYFLFRKKDKYIITFSLLCLGIFTYIFFNGEYLLYSLFPGLSGATILAMIYVAFYFAVTLNLILISELFPHEIPYWIIQIVKIVGLIAILCVILLPMHIYTYTMPVFRLYAVISGVYLIYKILMAAIHNRPGAKIIWVASSVIFLFMLNDLLYNAHIIETGEFIGWGVLFYLMILMIVSSRRFSRAISNEEKLLHDLQRLNDNLTYKVRERTQDLEEKSRIIAEQQKHILRKNQELIKTREEEKSIIKNIVHDLKAPFNKINGLLDVFRLEIQKENFTSEQNKILEMIRHVAKEGGSMVEDLNVVTFFEDTLKMNDQIEETDLMQLLEDLVSGYRGYAEKKQIELEFGSPVRKFMITTHQKSLSRVVDNLMSNAIKFSPPQTRVWISLRPYHDYFEINIKDEGPGFTDQDKVFLFEKFQRLSAKPTSGESSTGLGLNIVKTLTEGMGGRVELVEEKRGAHFKLVFPRTITLQSDQEGLEE